MDTKAYQKEAMVSFHSRKGTCHASKNGQIEQLLTVLIVADQAETKVFAEMTRVAASAQYTQLQEAIENMRLPNY